MKIEIAQQNYIVGNLQYNRDKILDAAANADNDTDIILFSELALTGYPPLDLMDNPEFIATQLAVLNEIVLETKRINSALLVGYINRETADNGTYYLYNAISLIYKGEVLFTYYKKLLPTYNIFDEARHFTPGDSPNIFTFKGKTMAFYICEDCWSDKEARRYKENPLEATLSDVSNIDVIITINASPSNIGKQKQREELYSDIVKRYNTPVIYVNQVGSNDDIIFDGNSFCINPEETITRLKAYEEDCCSITLNNGQLEAMTAIKTIENRYELMYEQIKLGIKDYLDKCGFKTVVIGSSGGIDSAVALAMAVKAIGAENVYAITMPSEFSSKGSVSDSELLAQNLGLKLYTCPIKNSYRTFFDDFNKFVEFSEEGITSENVQARIRGMMLMAFSNKNGSLVLSTGNKSELSVGYCTLYGDMNGGLSPLGDLYKMEVYGLAKYINATFGELIPNDIITKEPSAELAPDQKDSNSLPEYPLLDAILKEYIEGDLLDKNELEAIKNVYSKYENLDNIKKKIIKMVDRNEFKRRQSAPILRVQKRAFGFGRRLPIAGGFNMTKRFTGEIE